MSPQPPACLQVLPLRLDLSGQLTMRSLAARVAASAADDAAHFSLPLRELAQAAGAAPMTASVPGQPPAHPLSQAAFELPMADAEGGRPLDAFRCAVACTALHCNGHGAHGSRLQHGKHGAIGCQRICIVAAVGLPQNHGMVQYRLLKAQGSGSVQSEELVWTPDLPPQRIVPVRLI